MEKSRYKLLITYDGTGLHGWQKQVGRPTVQELIEKAFSKIMQTPIYVTGSGRTDSGVHALEQVAHVDLPNKKKSSLDQLHHSINALLPKQIRILSIEKVPFSFHARYSAVGKCYHYYIHTRRYADPFKRMYSLHYPHILDKQAIKNSLPYLLGKKNFTSFANEATKGSAANSPIKTLYTLQMIEEEGGFYLEFCGSGFLYKMVRNIMGTLLEIGKGKLSYKEIPKIFDQKDRKSTPATAPAYPLFLVKVYYEKSALIPSKEEICLAVSGSSPFICG